MPPQDWSILHGFLVALFVGLLIGTQREQGSQDAEHEPFTRNPAGVRTHTIVALLGALNHTTDVTIAGGIWLTVTGLLLVGIATITLFGLRAARTGRYGSTSVFALLTTYVLGALATTALAPLAAAIAVGVTATLAVKVPLHRFVRNLTNQEIAAAIKFGLIALVLLPWLPNRFYGPNDWPWLATELRGLGIDERWLEGMAIFNPYRLWFLVVAISGVGLAGYALTRALGPGRGLPVTGMVAGLVSSTAVTVSMAQQSRRTPELARGLAAAVVAACAVMAVRVAVLVLAFGTSLFPLVAASLAAMALSAAIIAWQLAKKQHDASDTQSMHLVTPFALIPAIKLSALVFLVSILARVLTLWFGDAGLLATAVFSGMVDVDAITAAICAETKTGGTTPARIAAIAIFTAVGVNTAVKAAMALALGSRTFGRATAAWLLLTLLLGALALVLVGM